MPEEKVFYPATAPETPFPGQDVPIVVAEARPPAGTYVPTATGEKPFPKKRIATELIGQALNTRSRRILAEFEFTPSGALQIGDFKQGETGDLRISPNGLTARDKAGITTFAIDGTTGDAIFKGTVQAGSVVAGAIISGDITVGGAGNSEGEIHVLDSTDVEKVTIDKDGIVINSGKLTIKDADETTIIDATGLVSTANFIFEGQSPSDGSLAAAEWPSWSDLTGSSQTISLDRNTNVFFFMSGEFWNNSIDLGQVRMIVDSTSLGFCINAIDNEPEQVSFQAIETLATGSHTFKLQVAVGTSGNSILWESVKKGYILLGK